MGDRESTGGLLALGAVGMAFCCGFPLLLSAGLLGTLAGIGLGSWLVIAAGLAVAALGIRRVQLRRTQPACEMPSTAGVDREVRDERTV